MKNYLILLAILVWGLAGLNQLQAQSPNRLSPQSRISLVTISPGSELYTTFGHSAIRIVDPLYQMDDIYNYGTFNFDEPGFYVKFVRGQLNYYLSAYDYRFAEGVYREEKRYVIEQTLNLTAEMKDQVFLFLRRNYQPANRFYRYDFFFDNCATRIRDVFETTLSDDLALSYNHDRKLTFRNYIDMYLTNQRFSDYGIDLALGAGTDEIATAKEALFLPDFLYEAFDKATIVIDGETVPFVASRDTLLWLGEPQKTETTNWPVIIIWTSFVIVLAAALCQWFIKSAQGRLFDWIDIMLFGFAGFIGLLVTFLWFATDHKVTPENWNLLWAWPSHLMVMGLLVIRAKRQWFSWYFHVNSAILVMSLLCWYLIPQRLHIGTFPLMLALLARSIWLARRYSNLGDTSSGVKPNKKPTTPAADTP